MNSITWEFRYCFINLSFRLTYDNVMFLEKMVKHRNYEYLNDWSYVVALYASVASQKLYLTIMNTRYKYKSYSKIYHLTFSELECNSLREREREREKFHCIVSYIGHH
jgi:hypothetical protein